MDLTNFTLEDLLFTAIKGEIESGEIYKKLSKRVKNFFLKERLEFLSSEEEKHKIFFEKIFQNKFPGKEIKLTDKISVPFPEIKIKSENELISNIFSQAMEAEKAAYDFYISLSMRFEQDSNMKKMLLYIAEMEKTHYRLIEIEKENAEKFEAYNIEWPMMHIDP